MTHPLRTTFGLDYDRIEEEVTRIQAARAEEARRVTQGYTVDELRALAHVNLYRMALEDALNLLDYLLHDDGTDTAIKNAERALTRLRELNAAPAMPRTRPEWYGEWKAAADAPRAR